MAKKTDAQKSRDSLLFRLTARFTAFLSGALLMAVIMYAAGSFGHYLDRTLNLLLLIGSVSSLALAIFSAAGIAESVVFGIAYRRKKYWLSLIPFVVALVAGAALFVVCRVITALSQGV